MWSDMWASEGFIIHSETLAQSQVSSYVTLKKLTSVKNTNR